MNSIIIEIIELNMSKEIYSQSHICDDNICNVIVVYCTDNVFDYELSNVFTATNIFMIQMLVN